MLDYGQIHGQRWDLKREYPIYREHPVASLWCALFAFDTHHRRAPLNAIYVIQVVYELGSEVPHYCLTIVG